MPDIYTYERECDEIDAWFKKLMEKKKVYTEPQILDETEIENLKWRLQKLERCSKSFSGSGGQVREIKEMIEKLMDKPKLLQEVYAQVSWENFYGKDEEGCLRDIYYYLKGIIVALEHKNE